MTETVGITKAIISLSDVRSKFNLTEADDRQFFTEWFEDLPEITQNEKETLNRLRNRYFYHLVERPITESTVKIVMLSPLLELMGLCDRPFRIRTEQCVKIEIENFSEEERTLEGFIDVLVVQEQLWITLIESKRSNFSVLQGIPQTLAYLMANPDSKTPLFGMIMNGEDYLFIKLDRRSGQYALSDKFTIVNQHNNELYNVMRVMKRIMRSIP